MQRRNFLKTMGALAGTAAFSQLGVIGARAATAPDYKALVCVFLYGGNDSNNTIVPTDPSGYLNYSNVRGKLALPLDTLLPLGSGASAVPYGLHPSLPGLQSLWNAGKLAAVNNVGTLVVPLDKAGYLSPTVPKPDELFSHIDQQHQWESSVSDTPSITSGWGGRLADQLAGLNAGSSLPTMISAGGNNLFVTGAASQALVIPTSGFFGLAGYGGGSADIVRRSAFDQILDLDHGNGLTDAAQGVMTQALADSAVLNPILAATDATLGARFAGLTNNFALQLLAIAKIIGAREQLGARRQVFLVTLGSFDTHTDQLYRQKALFEQLDSGLTAFHGAMSDLGADPNVTSFTISDFSRTFVPNTGGGTDHAWGSDQVVIGGSVRGGKFYGTMPDFVVKGNDDAGSEGRWIPTTAVDQYAATLASWFGADPAALAKILPNLGAFSRANLGFV